MRNCFIPGCDQLCRNVARRKMFSAPKDQESFNAWMAVLPKVRSFKPHDKVCERHFNKEDIYTTYDNVINGLVYKIERGRARLRLKAVPCRNLTTDIVPNRRRPPNRKNVKQTSSVEAKKIVPAKHKNNEGIISVHGNVKQDFIPLEIEQVHEIQEISSVECSSTTAPHALTVVEEEHLESIEISEVHVQELFDTLYDDVYEVVLPNTLWGVHRCPERSAIFFSFIDPSSLRTTKMITINYQGQTKIVLGNRLLNEQSLVVDINSAASLSEVIAEIDEMSLCPRVFENELCEVTLKEASEMCASCANSQ